MKKAICNIEFKISLSAEFYHVQNALIARLDSSCIVAIMPMKKAVQKSFSLSKSCPRLSSDEFASSNAVVFNLCFLAGLQRNSKRLDDALFACMYRKIKKLLLIIACVELLVYSLYSTI